MLFRPLRILSKLPMSSSVNSVHHQTPIRAPEMALAAILAVFTFCCAYFYAFEVPIGAPPDELAHLTYVKEVAEQGRLLPDYAGSTLMNSTSKNYLNHPPLYYSALGAVGRAFDWEAVADYRKFRLMSALMVSAGIAFWSLAMVLWGWSPIKIIAVVAASTAVPMFSYLAGSVNNDNLAYLGVAITFFAISARSTWPRYAYYVGAVGIIIIMMAKATAIAFIVIFMAAWLALRWRAGEMLLKHSHFRMAIVIAIVVCAAYYLPTLLVHGELFPKAGHLYGEMDPGKTMGLLEYSQVFGESIYRRLPVVMSHRSYAPLGSGQELVFYLMIWLPALAWLACRPFSSPGERRDLADAFVLALVGTGVIHMWEAFGGYQQTGLMAGIQPRYYSYALPGLFFIAFLDVPEYRLKRWLFVAFACVAAACLALVPPLAARSLVNKHSEAGPTPAFLSFASAVPDTELIMATKAAGDGAGYVDEMVVRNGQIWVRGWAIDTLTKHSASGVLFVHQERLIGVAPTGYARKDVARALDSAAAGTSGFRAVIQDIPEGLEPCSIRVLAQQQNGTLEGLRRPHCPTPP